MRTLACVGFLAAAAWAACPNQCSGHGYCDQNDRCQCFRGPGTKGAQRIMWTGYDCSQRVCPYGESFDAISDVTQELMEVQAGAASTVGFIPAPGTPAVRTPKMHAFINNGVLFPHDVGVEVKVVSINTSPTALLANFQFKLSTERTFNQEITLNAQDNIKTYCSRAKALHVRPDFNRDGTPEDSGLYIYFDLDAADFASATQAIFPNDLYYVNVTFNEGKAVRAHDKNSYHQLVECSGRGTCSRASGTCQCDVGYAGDACQRTICQNDCSGHGTCQNLRLFVEEGTAGLGNSLLYDAVDATQQMGCKCDAGFRGADCSQVECPSGPDPLNGVGGAGGMDCSGRGMCDYSSGTCRCFKGFFGERCEEITNLV